MAAMGRKRSRAQQGLPRYWVSSHGSFYFIVPARYAHIEKPGKWLPLGKTEEEAHRRYGELLAGENGGKMQQLFDRYENEILPKKAPKTQKVQKPELARLGKWCGHMRLGTVTRSLVQKYVDASKPVAGNRDLSLLSHVCNKGVRWELLTSNPCTGVERNKEKPKHEGADHYSMMVAWLIAKPWMRAMMAMAYVIGQRRGDLTRLKDSDYSHRGLVMTQGKTDTPLLLTPTRALVDAVAYAKSARRVSPIGGWLLCTDKGRQIGHTTFKREWARIRVEMAKDPLAVAFMFKSLRTQSGTDHETGEHLGHKDKRVLEKHYRLRRKVTPI